MFSILSKKNSSETCGEGLPKKNFNHILYGDVKFDKSNCIVLANLSFFSLLNMEFKVFICYVTFWYNQICKYVSYNLQEYWMKKGNCR